MTIKKAINIKLGGYADVYTDSEDVGKKYIIKVYGNRFEIASKESLEDLVKHHILFQEKAKKINVPIVSSKVQVFQSKKYIYAEVQEYIERNLRDILANSTSQREILKYVRQYLQMFHNVWKNDFIITLDPLTSNFGVDDKNIVRYFDFFPPIQKMEDDSIYEWPKPEAGAQDFIHERDFSIKQAQIIYAQLLRVLAQRRVVPFEKIKKLIVEYLGKPVANLIDVKKMNMQELVDNSTMDIVYPLRIFAGEKCMRGEISHKMLEEIFSLTHIPDDNTVLPIKKLREAIDALTFRQKHDEKLL